MSEPDAIKVTRRINRIVPLSRAISYPGSGFFDVVVQFPQDGTTQRRLWVLTPGDAPALRVGELEVAPTEGGNEEWHDYGIQEIAGLDIPVWGGGIYHNVKFSGIDPSALASSHLLITDSFDFDPRGRNIDDVERDLWGLARADTGRTAISPSRVQAGESARFRLYYTAGPKGLPPGSLIRFDIPKTFSTPQTGDPDAWGYVSADGAGALSVVSIEQSVEGHRKIDLICRVETALRPFDSLRISYSTEQTYPFPCVFADTDRQYWYSPVPPLSAAVALSEHHPFVSMRKEDGHACEFVAGPAERLHLFLPGRRREGETIELKGVFTDRYRNVPPKPIIYPDVTISLIGEEGSIDLGGIAGHLIDDHRIVLPVPALGPGVYRAVAVTGGTQVARSNPVEIVARDSTVPNVYWGEIHAHTNLTDGYGDFPELFRHARDEGSLDFGACAEHSEYITDNQWSWMQDVNNAFTVPGTFVALNGFEWSGKEIHRNVYTSRPSLQLFRGRPGRTSSIREVWDHFHNDGEVVGGPHAPLAHGIVWENHDPKVERFIEIYSVWGASDLRENKLVPDSARQNKRGMTVNEILATGARLGFTGGGDCHEGHIGLTTEIPDGQGQVPHGLSQNHLHRSGLTGALLPELTRSALINALRSRMTYATTGARILLDFAVDRSGQGNRVTCRAVVHAVNTLHCVEIIKSGSTLFRKEIEAVDVEFEWTDSTDPDMVAYYYLRAEQKDGHMAWSSPVWID